MRTIKETSILKFETQLYLNEKSRATTVKYVRAVRKLAEYLQGKELTKSRLLEYRNFLRTKAKVQTVNGELSAISAFLGCMDWGNLKVNLLKVQRRAFLDESRELTGEEYRRLLAAAQTKGNERL